MKTKKLYTVHAHVTVFAMGNQDGKFGPFESRAEAERTMTGVVTSGKYARVYIETSTKHEDEDED